jgi:hypothetical protein
MKKDEVDNIEERITDMLEKVLKDDSDSDKETKNKKPINKQLSLNKPFLMVNNMIVEDVAQGIRMENVLMPRLSPKVIPKKISTQTDLPRGCLNITNNNFKPDYVPNFDPQR